MILELKETEKNILLRRSERINDGECMQSFGKPELSQNEVTYKLEKEKKKYIDETRRKKN
jgi:hypothetical protein